MSTSLQDITNEWGNWMSTKYPDGGGIKFTESTNYDNYDELDQYHNYQTNATYQSINYDPNAPSPIPGTAYSATTSYNNGSSIQQSYTYQQNMTTQQTFTWSITSSLSIGLEISEEVEVPDVAKVGTKLTTKIDLSSTAGSTESQTQSWSVTQPINVPPNSHVDAKMVAALENYNINWSACCLLTGYVAIWFHNKVALNPNNYHWLWFVPIQNVISACVNNNIIDTTGYEIVSNGVLAYSSGTFYGGQGVGVCINVEQSPLDITSNAKSNSIKTIEIPIDINGANALIGAE